MAMNDKDKLDMLAERIYNRLNDDSWVMLGTLDKEPYIDLVLTLVDSLETIPVDYDEEEYLEADEIFDCLFGGFSN